MAARIYGSEMRRLELGSRTIRYELIRKSVKNINLRIDAAGNVKVSANRYVPVGVIEDFMSRKQEFIVAAVERAKQRCRKKENEPEATPRQYAEKEQLRLLGKTFEIKVVQSMMERIYFDNRFLYFEVKCPENARHRELLYKKWLKEYQRAVYEKVCRRVYEIFKPFGVAYPQIKIRKMTSRWGSCQPYRGIVTLNSRLIETPCICIEYVAMHEFAHFIYPNHSKEFHALMTRLMPDWKQRKKLLNSITEWNET